MAQVKITLGDHEYVIHPQRHAYLRHRLGDELEKLGEFEPVADQNFLDQIIEKAYEFLSVFIPDVMPRWEFEGYGTPTAWEEREYDEAADHSPSPDQIITAFESALRVNRLDLVKHLKTWVGEDYLRAQVQVMIGELTTRALDTSQNSPSTNGGSDSTSSTTSEPTPTLSSVPDTGSDLPSDDSTTS